MYSEGSYIYLADHRTYVVYSYSGSMATISQITVGQIIPDFIDVSVTDIFCEI